MINFNGCKKPLSILVPLCLFLYGCNSTEPVLKTKRYLNQSELTSIVQEMPNYMSLVELKTQHHEDVRRKLSALSIEQKERIQLLFSTYINSHDFSTRGTIEERELLDKMANTIYNDELKTQKNILASELKQKYQFDHKDLFFIMTNEVDLNHKENSRTKMPCSEVYNQVYWQIVEDMYIFAEQNQSIPDAAAIDRAAGYAADYAYIGCIMAGL